LTIEGPRGIPGQAIGVLCALRAAEALLVEPALAALGGSNAPRKSMHLLMLLGLLLAAPMLILALVH
jgi:hypothetical protein